MRFGPTPTTQHETGNRAKEQTGDWGANQSSHVHVSFPQRTLRARPERSRRNGPKRRRMHYGCMTGVGSHVINFGFERGGMRMWRMGSRWLIHRCMNDTKGKKGEGGGLCLEDKLAVGKVDFTLVLALGDAGTLVLFQATKRGDDQGVSGKLVSEQKRTQTSGERGRSVADAGERQGTLLRIPGGRVRGSGVEQREGWTIRDHRKCGQFHPVASVWTRLLPSADGCVTCTRKWLRPECAALTSNRLPA